MDLFAIRISGQPASGGQAILCRQSRALELILKPIKLITLAVVVLVFLFLFTRPSDYRNLRKDISGTLEDQWCAWSEVVGNECDRWRHAHRIIDKARQFREELGSRIPVTAPAEDASSKQD